MSSHLRGFLGAPSALIGLARRARPASSPPPPLPAPAHEISVAPRMTVTRTDSATECRLHIEGALDVHSAPEIRAVFDSVVSEERLVVDLAGLTMMDSSGVGAIVGLFKRVKAAGGVIVFEGVQNQPLAVCKLLKLDRVFNLS